MNMTETNVMAETAMTPLPTTKAINANERAAIPPKLQKWVNFIELITNEMCPVHQEDEVAPFIREDEDKRKMRADKRLHAKLRNLEIEHKAILLAEAQKSMEEARRKFESQPSVPYDYAPGPPSSIEDFFREEKARNELKALELEQKEELLRQVMEKRARELGEEWPPAEDSPDTLRFDHIPKRWPGYKGLIPDYFHDHPLILPQEPNEKQPAASTAIGGRPQLLEPI
jgi:hypothetical protein